jgi:hypothetical protein
MRRLVHASLIEPFGNQLVGEAGGCCCLRFQAMRLRPDTELVARNVEVRYAKHNLRAAATCNLYCCRSYQTAGSCLNV